MQERNRSKAGRMARLKGRVENVEALDGAHVDAARAKVVEMPVRMRQQNKEAMGQRIT
jgi:hypothetical protein